MIHSRSPIDFSGCPRRLVLAGRYRAQIVAALLLVLTGSPLNADTTGGQPTRTAGIEGAAGGPVAEVRGSSTQRGEQSGSDTRYLLFQFFTYQGHRLASLAEVRNAVGEIIDALGGLRGDGKTRQLGLAVGALSLDQTDAELREIVRESFKIADEKNVAVAFHIDDSMFWLRRSDLWRDPRNVEWIDWTGTPHPQRYVDWVGVKLAPQMCYTSPTLRKEVGRIARDVIGAEIARGMSMLRAKNKSHLFAGVIAGWETHLADYGAGYGSQDPQLVRRMERDGSPRVRYGYCALSNRGFSGKNPPRDFAAEIAKVVRDWAAFWAKELNRAGISHDRIYTHFASRDWQAFNPFSRPGFTAYDRGSLGAIYQTLSQNGNPHWTVAEGTNLDESFQGLPWEAFLGGIFNHGGTLAVIFGWHEKNMSPYGRATTSGGAVAAYKKFLRGEPLSEEVNESLLSSLQRKMRRIQQRAPAYLGSGGDQARFQQLLQRTMQYASEGNTPEAERTADELLDLIAGGK